MTSVVTRPKSRNVNPGRMRWPLATAMPVIQDPGGRYVRAAVGTVTALLAKSTILSAEAFASASRAEQEDADTARLIAASRPDGEQLAQAIYERYVDRVYSYLRLTLHSPAEAEDATQEVFIRVLEALPAYEQREAPFRAWLFRIARNAAINRMRRNRRLIVESPTRLEARLSRTPERASRPDVESISDGGLLAAIEALPRSQQQVITLRYLFELRSTEIADLLERSPEAVRQLHQRAMRTLRARLGPARMGPGGA